MRDAEATPTRPRALRELDDDPVLLPGRSPWGKVIALLLVVVAFAAVGYFGWRQYQSHRAEMHRTMDELRDARRKAGEAEGREKQTAATLASRETDLAALRVLEAEVVGARLSAEQAAAIQTKLREALGDVRGELGAARGRVTLELPEDALFEAGESDLTEPGQETLSRIGKALGTFSDTQVWVEAYTGNRRPRDKKAFPSNWELSTQRALSVVHHLEDESDLDGKRLAALGFGQHRAREDRAKSPRIEIVVFRTEVVAPPPVPTPVAATAAPGTGLPGSVVPASAGPASGAPGSVSPASAAEEPRVRRPRRRPPKKSGGSGLGPL